MNKFWLFLNVRYEDSTGMDGYSGAFDTFEEAAKFSFESNEIYFHVAQIVEVQDNTPSRQWWRMAGDLEFKAWD
jgi:hypothetical protein